MVSAFPLLIQQKGVTGDHCHHETQACSDFLLDDQVSVYLLTVISIQRLCESMDQEVLK